MGLALLALVFISLVLRPAVAVIGPLLPEIIADLGLSGTQAGLLNAAPVLCFGVGAFLSPRLVRWVGIDKALLLVLGTLTLSMALRGLVGYPVLLIGTVAAGLSIATANVVLPAVVRRDFPNSVPLVTGLYTTILAISASVSASTATSFSQALGGWALGSAFWALPSLLALVLWLPKVLAKTQADAGLVAKVETSRPRLHRDALAWHLVGFFGLQSLGFYAVLGWLPSILLDNGYSNTDVSALLAIATSVGIPFGLALSAILGRFRSLAWWSAGASLVTAAGLLGLAVAVQALPWLLVASCVLIGIGQASTFPISLSLISIKASSANQTTSLSAMAQGYGYLLSALGTFAVGQIAFSLNDWVPSLWVLVGLTLVQAIAGFLAGRPTHTGPGK